MKGLLHIRRTLYKSKFYAPKSKAAIRTVDLGDQAVAMLSGLKRQHYGEQDPPAEVLIFPGRNGQPQDPAALRRGAWARALRRAGLPYRHPHTLRHSFVSMLHEQGQDIAYIALQVGHSSSVITATTYCKVLTPRRRHVASGIETALRANTLLTPAPESTSAAQDKAALSA